MEWKHFHCLGFRLLAIGEEVYVDGMDNREERQSTRDKQPVNSGVTQRDVAFLLGHSSIAALVFPYATRNKRARTQTEYEPVSHTAQTSPRAAVSTARMPVWFNSSYFAAGK